MTTPSTAQVRAWARSQDVADRGPLELEARVAGLVERVAALEGGSARAGRSLLRRRQS